MKSMKAHKQFPKNNVVIPKKLINVVLHKLLSSSNWGHMGINHTTARAKNVSSGLARICSDLY